MKKLLTIVAIFITTISYAQKEKIEVKNDTLIVPLGSCKVIKLGDKYYEVEVNLKEVPTPDTISSGSIYLPNWQNPGILLAPYSGTPYTPYSSENIKAN